MEDWCGGHGCKFHDYPYEAQVPISGEKDRVYKCNKDVWDVVKLLIAEIKETNDKMGRDFDIASSISYQLPFFSCMNIILNNGYQKDISQYLYCKEFGISPFKGSYGEQPMKWIQKTYVIKNAMTKRDNKLQKKAQREAEINTGAHDG